MTDLDRLLEFAARSRLPEGGFGYLGDDGRVQPDRGQETWIVARMTHVFGLAQLTGRSGWDGPVRRNVARPYSPRPVLATSPTKLPPR